MAREIVLEASRIEEARAKFADALEDFATDPRRSSAFSDLYLRDGGMLRSGGKIDRNLTANHLLIRVAQNLGIRNPEDMNDLRFIFFK